VVRDAAYLCGSCRDRLARLLADLPVLFAELEESLTTARRRPPARARSSGLSLEPIVVKAREHLAMWLFGWVRVVAEERGLTLPLSEQPDVLAHWLGRHLDWLAHQPFADEVLANLEETHREARAARQIVPPRVFPLKDPTGDPVRCTHHAEGPVRAGRQPPTCQGIVTAVVRDASPLLPSELTCSGDPAHAWAPHEWMTLGRQVNPGMDPDAMGALTRAIRGVA